MTHEETLKRYKAMTNAERAAISCQLIRENWRALLQGPKEVVARRIERINAENDARNRNMLEAIARTRMPAASSETPSSPVPNSEGERGKGT